VEFRGIAKALVTSPAATASTMGTTVKSEVREDDAEIREMARRITEQNRQKMNPAVPGAVGSGGPMQMARPGQPAIQNYLSYQQQAQGRHRQQQSGVGPPAVDDRLDVSSKKGRFGWCEFEKNFIPFIFRSANVEKYTSVRMVERKLLGRFLSVLPPEVNSCHCIRSYYITDAESKLLNDINLRHTDCYFGKEAFTTKDLVVRLKDAKEFYRFLDLCYKKLVMKKSNASDRCGFFRINGESVVPYTVREGVKYVPLFYFEGETDNLKMKSDQVEGWDLAYLKFCCKVQGIRNELFAADICRVVALEEIKGHFPQGTTFEDYWPAKGSIEPVNAQKVGAGNWTQKPAQSAGAAAPSAQPSSHQIQTAAAAAAQALHNSQKSHGVANGGNSGAATAFNLQQYASAAAAQTSAAQQRTLYDNQTVTAAMLQHPQYRQYLQQLTTIQQQAAAAAAAQMAAAQAQAAVVAKTFPGRLTQIKDFPIERSSQAPYKLQKALIDEKMVTCINVRPYVLHDPMMTLPDFIKNFCPDQSIERARYMLQDILKITLYKGNRGHQEVLRAEGKCVQYDPVPLILVKDIISFMPQMKYMFAANMGAAHGDPAAKRQRIS